MGCEGIDTELSRKVIRYKVDSEIPAIKEARIQAAIKEKQESLEVDIDAQVKTAIELIYLDFPEAEFDESEIRRAIERDAAKHLREVIGGVVKDYGRVKKSRIDKRFWGKKYSIGDMIMYEDGLIEEVKKACRGTIKEKHSLLPNKYTIFRMRVWIGVWRILWFRAEGRMVVETFDKKRFILQQMQKENCKTVRQFLKRKLYQAAMDTYAKRVKIFPNMKEWISFMDLYEQQRGLREDMQKQLQPYQFELSNTAQLVIRNEVVTVAIVIASMMASLALAAALIGLAIWGLGPQGE